MTTAPASGPLEGRWLDVFNRSGIWSMMPVACPGKITREEKTKRRRVEVWRWRRAQSRCASFLFFKEQQTSPELAALVFDFFDPSWPSGGGRLRGSPGRWRSELWCLQVRLGIVTTITYSRRPRLFLLPSAAARTSFYSLAFRDVRTCFNSFLTSNDVCKEQSCARICQYN